MDGRRVRTSTGGQVASYLWDTAAPLADVILETDGNGAPIASYVLGDGMRISQRRGGTTSYYLYDGQRSVRALTDAGGNTTDSYTYDAFGATVSRTGTTANPYQ